MDSCATLLRDTLVGHSPTTLTYSDVFWPRKLTVLRPQLPEAGSRTTFVLESCQFYSSQKLLAALHLYYQVASSEATALRSYMCITKWTVLRPAKSHFLYYICTAKWPVLRQKPKLQVLRHEGPEAASRTTYVLPSGLSWGHSSEELLPTLHVRYKLPLLKDTLVVHSCVTLL